MITQDTSYESYQYALKTMSKRQHEVLRVLRNLDRATNHEISERTGWAINTVTPRIKELRNKGLVHPAGTKIDVTGRRAIVWEPVYPKELFN